jgi:hypothetical protein
VKHKDVAYQMSGIIWIKEVIKKIHTSAGTIGALTAEAASSPFRAPMTASAISIATPSYEI